uniref:Uncharacterized protein n=1 Tax=Arundo donax TaxID=35708 RepID=A0A0A9HNS4_ARUDO
MSFPILTSLSGEEDGHQNLEANQSLTVAHL